MKKNFTKKLMAAAILLVTAVSPSWADSVTVGDLILSKDGGTPVEGTDYNFSYGYSYEIKTNGLTISNATPSTPCKACFDIGEDVTSLKFYNINISSYGNISRSLMKFNGSKTKTVTLTFEGQNTFVQDCSGYNAWGSHADNYNVTLAIDVASDASLYITGDVGTIFLSTNYGSNSNTASFSFPGLQPKGSTSFNATNPNEELTTGIYDSWYKTFFPTSDNSQFCRTIQFGERLDPDAEYVIVTYKAGSDTKKAYYKTSDVEKIEWLKGEDITE